MHTCQNNRIIALKFILLIVILVAVISLGISFIPLLTSITKNPINVRDYMLSVGLLGGLLFLLIQVAHVIIAVIPGDFLYVLGGYIFGAPMGFLLSFVGVMIGTVIVFYFSRLLGYDFVNKFIPHNKIEKFSNLLNSNKGMLGLFAICLIPIIPKDPLMYVAGLTPIKAPKLFLVYALSRIPVTLTWVMVGAQAYNHNYLEMVIMLIILFLIATLCLIIQKEYKKRHQSIAV